MHQITMEMELVIKFSAWKSIQQLPFLLFWVSEVIFGSTNQAYIRTPLNMHRPRGAGIL